LIKQNYFHVADYCNFSIIIVFYYGTGMGSGCKSFFNKSIKLNLYRAALVADLFNHGYILQAWVYQQKTYHLCCNFLLMHVYYLGSSGSLSYQALEKQLDIKWLFYC